ncbi:helix-turn-helix transcriptional regulator [Olsenella sp. An293]|uniref:helix-turn-helix domain-containing protein n=1 Tax=Olsenella sp. An293 TaxID=1965626 RepID=UPI000B3864BE|nr:helix-turn-helix transcriptional regulator [Olsenella sp. An293]OUO31561.1 hypothetical protein B5F85_10110 [Olsenella sp. An293]
MDTAEACKFVRARVGSNVGRLCCEKGLSQSRFAAMIGVDRSHLNQLIGGKSNVTLDVLVKIADGLDVPLTSLFFGLGDAAPQRIEYDGTPEGAAQ